MPKKKYQSGSPWGNLTPSTVTDEQLQEMYGQTGGGDAGKYGVFGTGYGSTNPFSAGAGVVGGLFGGIGAYQQAKSQKSALGTALGHARQIPGMYEEAYAPGIERAGDIYSAYKPRGSMYQGMKRTISGGLSAGQTNLPPHLRKLMGRENLSKAETTMQGVLPQFAQAQQQAAGQLTGLEVGLGQGKIGAQQNIAELEAARKGINPTASAFGNIGATLMSFVQGGGKLPHGGEVRGPHHAAGGVDAGKDVEVQGGEYVVNAISANKHKALLESINRDDNEMTIMDGMYGEKHSAHGNEVYQAGGKMQEGGGILNLKKPIEDMSDSELEELTGKSIDELKGGDWFEGDRKNPFNSLMLEAEMVLHAKETGKISEKEAEEWSEKYDAATFDYRKEDPTSGNYMRGVGAEGFVDEILSGRYNKPVTHNIPQIGSWGGVRDLGGEFIRKPTYRNITDVIKFLEGEQLPESSYIEGYHNKQSGARDEVSYDPETYYEGESETELQKRYDVIDKLLGSATDGREFRNSPQRQFLEDLYIRPLLQDTSRVKKAGGGMMGNETLLNRIIKDTYGKR